MEIKEIIDHSNYGLLKFKAMVIPPANASEILNRSVHPKWVTVYSVSTEKEKCELLIQQFFQANEMFNHNRTIIVEFTPYKVEYYIRQS